MNGHVLTWQTQHGINTTKHLSGGSVITSLVLITSHNSITCNSLLRLLDTVNAVSTPVFDELHEHSLIPGILGYVNVEVRKSLWRTGNTNKREVFPQTKL